jgi:hypothetical protein
MLTCEASLPDVLPPKETFEELERQYSQGNHDIIATNPQRYLGLLQTCVKHLTLFDMPEADKEVSAFIERYERKHGNSEAGKHFLKSYRTEIKHALADRKNGVVPWKQDRKDRGREF